MSRLAALLAARNVRAIVFRLSPATARDMLQCPDTPQAVQLLQTQSAVSTAANKLLDDDSHGFRVGCISDHAADESAASSAFDFAHFGDAVDASVFERASQALNVPLQRTMLVTDATSECAGEVPIEMVCASLCDHTSDIPADSSVSADQQLSAFVQSLLGVKPCSEAPIRLFGPLRVLQSQVFHSTMLSFALVNLKPIVPGHVLVVPKRCVGRFEHLDSDEVADLWCTAQRVGKTLERHYSASALTFAIQARDGAIAGQTVEHVHIHVLPRVAADFPVNDDVYTEIDAHERRLCVDNKRRSARSELEMVREAASLRALFD